MKSYKEILGGKGFTTMDSKPSIEIVHQIRHSLPVGIANNCHPFAKFQLARHPFDIN
jgi:UDP-N-acetyl-2-amino-2-deoxyglucuronate dehydrogenase